MTDRDVAGVHGGDGEPGREVPVALRRAVGIDEDRAAFSEPACHVHRIDQGRVQYDQVVGLRDLAAKPDRSVVEAEEGRDRGPAPLDAEGRKRLYFVALSEQGHREELGGDYGSLSASTMYSKFEHHRVLVRRSVPCPPESLARAVPAGLRTGCLRPPFVP